MNETINTILLGGGKVMADIHLRQSDLFGNLGFTYNACGSFTKNKERIQKCKETGNSRYIY